MNPADKWQTYIFGRKWNLKQCECSDLGNDDDEEEEESENESYDDDDSNSSEDESNV